MHMCRCSRRHRTLGVLFPRDWLSPLNLELGFLARLDVLQASATLQPLPSQCWGSKHALATPILLRGAGAGVLNSGRVLTFRKCALSPTPPPSCVPLSWPYSTDHLPSQQRWTPTTLLPPRHTCALEACCDIRDTIFTCAAVTATDCRASWRACELWPALVLR